MNSPNNIVIDQIPNDYIVQVHEMLDQIRLQYGIRLRIKKDGRTSSPLAILPLAADCYDEVAQ
jgi:hypothetical protein